MRPFDFELFHPIVFFTYFAISLLLCMCVIHPIISTLFLLGACIVSFSWRGAKKTARSLMWQIPLICIIALVNPLISSSGSTEIFRIAQHSIYVESLLYGLCMACIFCAVILIFANASCAIKADVIRQFLSAKAPTIGFVFSYALSLIPRMFLQAQEIRLVQKVNMPAAAGEGVEGRLDSDISRQRGSGARERTGASVEEGMSTDAKKSPAVRVKVRMKEKTKENLRLVSVVMGNAVEDSLESANAMRSRGWASGGSRTHYKHLKFRVRDVIALSVIVILGFLVAFLCFVATSQFVFYPRTSTLIFWWGYIPIGVFALFPLVFSFYVKRAEV